MRALILTLAFVLAFVPRAEAQQTEIEAVISSQINAFKMDDFATAFSFATPSIRSIFQTPENFGRMVAQGYPMVWRPSEVTYLELKEDQGAYLQLVQIVDAKGQQHLLAYRMQQMAGDWKISGVQLLKQAGVSA